MNANLEELRKSIHASRGKSEELDRIQDSLKSYRVIKLKTGAGPTSLDREIREIEQLITNARK